jgi:two-component system sporulation sensor kinase B
MCFPAIYGLGYRLDIRIIPLLLGTLYGGIGTGIFLSAVVIFYRLCSVDVGFYIAVLTLIFTIPIFVLFQKSFEKAEKKKRVKIAILLSSHYIVVGISWFWILRGETAETLMVQGIHLIFIVVLLGF